MERENRNEITKSQNGGGNAQKFKPLLGCIEIGDNVMIGAGSIILPDVRIGNNVIIAAGSIVSKDIPDNSVAGGIPAKVIGDFDKIVAKRSLVESMCNEELWIKFEKDRK